VDEVPDLQDGTSSGRPDEDVVLGLRRGSQGLWEQSRHPNLSLRSFQKPSIRC